MQPDVPGEGPAISSQYGVSAGVLRDTSAKAIHVLQTREA
jgi:hypothetical protein